MRKTAESPSTGVPMSTIVPRSCPPRLASAAARILFLAVILTLMTPLSFSSAASAAKRRSDADILPPLTSPLDFTLTAHGSGEGPTVLIVGGIQGDEPGGFSAAALLATHYRYDGGTVLVIPNLNFPSIIKRSRGLHGDMNRKFAALRESDPEYATVRRLQSIITRPEIDLVLNLHDGSGFYRPAWESPTHNPGRWGQSVIIDQEELPGAAFGRLGENARAVTEEVNARLLAAAHALHVRNTRTGDGDTEMAKSLTWFALNHGKAAYGLEVSKDFGVKERAYYQLCMVEAFLRIAGVKFERDFPLTAEGVLGALGRDVYAGFMDNRLVLPLSGVRRNLAGSIPLPEGGEKTLSANMPIVAVSGERGRLTIHYGNNMVTSFRPEWRESDSSIDAVTVLVDGEEQRVRFGDEIRPRETFLVKSMPGFRVNAIGATLGPDESDITIRRRDFRESYSLDTAGDIYRVEIYRGNRYAGTFTVRFGIPGVKVTTPLTLPAIKGRESSLGW